MKPTIFSFISILIILIFSCSCDRLKKPKAAMQHPSVLRVSSEEPLTLDPRQARDLTSATYIYMLYEGLMRCDATGKPQPALAEDVTISPNQTTYIFRLRESGWSSGDLVTAHDFEESWKNQLNPQTPAPNAYQLYVIKGAQAAKEGRAPLDQVGVHATDDKTLIVELEQPTPYFLNLVASYFYYPVHAEVRQRNLLNNESTGTKLISNGPFKLDDWSHHNELVASKNPYYWDIDHTYLDKIVLMHVEPSTALQMFGRNELDWIGSPLSTIPAEAIVTLKTKGDLQIKPAAATYWFRFNTEKDPFNHVKMRQAFNLALNRQELIDHVLQGNQQPAIGIIPPCVAKNPPFFKDNDVENAQELFKQVLEERQISRHELVPITLFYAKNERNHKIAQVVQQQWSQAFGIEVRLQANESKMQYDILKNHGHQIALGAWFADIMDPISFLEIFKFKDNGTNNTLWENPDYIHTLNASSQLSDSQSRQEVLKKAEEILMAEMPVAPLFYSNYHYLKQPEVKGVYFSEIGYLDFKSAYKVIIPQD